MPKVKPKHHIRAVFKSLIDDTGRVHGETRAWHKTAWSGSPYCVPNELIAGQIGQFIKLPIPPFTISYSADKTYFFSSLDFNFNQDQLPPIEPDLTWKNLPNLCTGVTVFDILIANNDRHDENLVVDELIKPTLMQVIDHDQALMGGNGALRGIDRLHAIQDQLGISGGAVSGGNRHCLIDVIDSYKHFNFWIDRIKDIPDWYIEETCDNAQTYGLTYDESFALKIFLKHRRDSIEDIIKKHSDEFSAIKQWPLFLG